MIIEAQLFLAGLFLLIFSLIMLWIMKQGEKYVSSLFLFMHTIYCAFIGGFIALLISMFILGAMRHTKHIVLGAFLGAAFGFIQSLVLTEYPKKFKRFKKDYEWVNSTWSAFIIASVVMYTTIQAFKIPSGSMRNTLLEGDHLFVLKFIYGIKIPFTDIRILNFAKPERFSLVVFKAPEQALEPYERGKGIHKDFIKRVVGLPGDIVEIKNKVVYINGKPLKEDYVNIADRLIIPKFEICDSKEKYEKIWLDGNLDTRVRDNFGPVKVPENSYFVLGDNRDQSKDSRFWGPLYEEYLRGKPLLIYWPPSRIKFLLK